MRCFNKDEEWGFFVDLEIDYENITKKIIQPIKIANSNSRKTVNYMSTIYEDDYWYEREDFHHEYDGEYEIKKHNKQEDTENNNNNNNNNNDNDKEKYDKPTTATIVIYFIFCASVISLSLTLV
jgi:DNA-directed RNA polymerase delta subunit